MLDSGAHCRGLLSPAVFNKNGKEKTLLTMCVFCLAFVTRGADSDAGVHTTVTTAVLCCAVLGWAGEGVREDLCHPWIWRMLN